MHTVHTDPPPSLSFREHPHEARAPCLRGRSRTALRWKFGDSLTLRHRARRQEVRRDTVSGSPSRDLRHTHGAAQENPEKRDPSSSNAVAEDHPSSKKVVKNPTSLPFSPPCTCSTPHAKRGPETASMFSPWVDSPWCREHSDVGRRLHEAVLASLHVVGVEDLCEFCKSGKDDPLREEAPRHPGSFDPEFRHTSPLAMSDTLR